MGVAEPEHETKATRMNRDTRSLIGASVLNGAGSLPLHLSPLIVAVLVADGGTSTFEAGASRAAVLLGQLTTALALPTLNVRQLNRSHTAAAGGVLLFGLGVSQLYLLAGWFLVGLSCGLLGYLGTLTAALHTKPSYAFLVRLGITLCIAGATAAMLRLMPTSSYTMTVIVLASTLGFLLTTGIGLQLPIRPPPPKERTREERRMEYLVQGIIFFLFVGQNGMLTYVLQQANERGLTLGQVLWALAIIKMAGGLMLLALRQKKINIWVLAILLAGADIIVATTSDVTMFVLGLLFLDLTFCLMAPKLQALAATIAPIFAGQWSLAILQLGGAAGTLLHGYAITVGLPFEYLAVASALLPLVLRKMM